jgi:hypothetical protein
MDTADAGHVLPGPAATLVLDFLAEAWSGTECELIRTDAGLNWHPGRFKVAVRTQSRRDRGYDEARIVVRTDFLKEARLDDQALQLMVSLGGFAPAFAWVLVPPSLSERLGERGQEGKIWLQAVFYATESNARGIAYLVAANAVLQAMCAEFQSGEAGKILKAQPDESSLKEGPLHPDLCLLDSDIRPAGQERCPLTESPEFAEIARVHGKNDLCFGTGGVGGVTLETPFGESSALITVRTDIPHPSFGNGLLASVELPFSDTKEAITDFSINANFSQAVTWSDAPLVGGWHPKESGDGTWHAATAAFMPNFFCRPAMPTYFALSQIRHARFIKETFWPTLKDLTMLDVLQNRMGAASTPKAK